MKYRRLTLRELETLEKEFVDFLVVNTITAEEWKKMKQQNSERVEELIEQFSDTIFESILRNTKYLEFRGDKELYAYQCLEEKIVLVGMNIKEESPLSFKSKELLQKNIVFDQNNMEIFTTEKSYGQNREKELFLMLDQGCEISNGDLFKKLCLAL